MRKWLFLLMLEKLLLGWAVLATLGAAAGIIGGLVAGDYQSCLLGFFALIFAAVSAFLSRRVARTRPKPPQAGSGWRYFG